MPQQSGLSDPSDRPASVRVPSRGVPGRAAAVVAVGVLAIIVGLGLADDGNAQPRGSQAAVLNPTATPTATPSATATRASVPTPAGDETVAPVPCTEVAPTGGTPLPDVAAALAGDDGSGPLPLGTIDTVPNEDRLDFLFELPGCFRDAHWIDPRNPSRGSGTWTAGRPFHVREGFVNNGVEPLGEEFDVVLYVSRREGDVAPTYRYTSDYVLRGTTDRCGPSYRTQSEPETCEWFVHDFPDGLPEGRWAIWALWEAPCGWWVDLGLAYSCAEPQAVVSLFGSGFDAPYELSGPDYAAQRTPDPGSSIRP